MKTVTILLRFELQITSTLAKICLNQLINVKISFFEPREEILFIEKVTNDLVEENKMSLN